MIVMTWIQYIHVHQLHHQLLACFQAKSVMEDRLQKSVEDALGQCRTLVFLTNDIPTLQTALDQCKVVIETLTSSSTTSVGPKVPPVFHSIAKAGVEEFKATSKTLHRVGVKRKRNDRNQLQTKKPRKEE